MAGANYLSIISAPGNPASGQVLPVQVLNGQVGDQIVDIIVLSGTTNAPTGFDATGYFLNQPLVSLPGAVGVYLFQVSGLLSGATLIALMQRG